MANTVIFIFVPLLLSYIYIHNIITITVSIDHSQLPFSLPSALKSFSSPISPHHSQSHLHYVLPNIYPTDILSLTNILVSIPSPTGNEDPVFVYSSSWAKYHKLSVKSQPIPPLSSNYPPRQNILIYSSKTKSIQSLRVILSTHLDTVPSTIAMRQGNDSNRIYGRGSVDAKGLAAAMLIAMLKLQRKSDVGILFVCGEEKGHDGMKLAHLYGFSKNIILINGEPTENKIATRQKGMLRATLETYGYSAHSGYPHLGKSAIHKLISISRKLLNEFHDDKIKNDDDNKGITTLNIGEIKGGSSAVNVISNYAQATLLYRIATSVEQVVEKTKEIIYDFDLGNNTIKFVKGLSNDPMVFYVPDHIKHKVGTTEVAYNTDLPYYKGECEKMILFGAGSIHQAHTDDEYIEIKELIKLPGLYVDIIHEILSVDYQSHTDNNNDDDTIHDEI